MKAVHLVIEGLVQGVSYRANALRRAQRLGISGWVRNRHDGSVEAFAQGADGDVDAFVEWCRQGPSLAEVSRVGVRPMPFDGTVSGFDVRPTG